MENFFTTIFNQPMVPLAAVIGGCAAWAIIGVAKQWRKVRVAELEAGLKRQMLEKEMPAEEMERVLRASKDDWGEETYAFNGDADGDRATLVKMLSDYSYSGKDIERVLQGLSQAAAGADSVSARRARVKAAQGMIENSQSAEEIEQMLRAFQVKDAPANRDGIQELRM